MTKKRGKVWINGHYVLINFKITDKMFKEHTRKMNKESKSI